MEEEVGEHGPRAVDGGGVRGVGGVPGVFEVGEGGGGGGGAEGEVAFGFVGVGFCFWGRKSVGQLNQLRR